MVDIKYPLTYDANDQILIDASGQTIALMSWPSCGLNYDVVNQRGEDIVKRINLDQREVVELYPPIKEEISSASEPGIFEKAKNLVNKVFENKSKVKSYNYVKRARVCITPEGKIVTINTRGRLKKGWKIYDGNGSGDILSIKKAG
jgi:hypothetical protein